MLNRIVDFFFSADMLRNLVAEALSIIVTVALIDRLIAWRERRNESRRWSRTRRRVGEVIGWAHTVLGDQLDQSTKNGYEIFFEWSESVQEMARQAKQQYAFAFNAEMAGTLEEYEEFVRSLGEGVRIRQWTNMEMLDMVNRMGVEFLTAAGVLENDIEHLYKWKEPHIARIKGRLLASDIREASVPPRTGVIAW